MKTPADRASRLPTFAAATLTFLAASCGGGPATGGGSATPSPQADTNTSEPKPEQRPARDPRLLVPNASFADLVSLVADLDEPNSRQQSEAHKQSEARPSAGCVFAPGANPNSSAASSIRFEADIAAAAHPIPAPPADLASIVEPRPHTASVLTRWGPAGDRSAGALLVALTSSPALRETRSVAAFITRSGVYLRPVGAADPSRTTAALAPKSMSDALAKLALPARDGLDIIVTAEAAVTVHDMLAYLRALPTNAHVLLAVALPRGTQLPSSITTRKRTPDETSESSAACPSGLPPIRRRLGDLDPRTLRAPLAAIQQAAQACQTQHANGLGARLKLLIRLAPDGTLDRACTQETSPEQTSIAHTTPASESLRTCLVRALESIKFPAPTPAGFVDLALPITIEPDMSLRHTALCE